MEFTNTYSGLIDDWKIELIDQCAWRRGFRWDELPEVRQEIALDIHQFQYDPSHGASERTALTTLIHQRLSHIIRTRTRRRANEVPCAEFVEEEGTVDDSADPHHQQDLHFDLAPVLATLEPVERKVCAGLAQGDSLRTLSTSLRLSRYEIGRTIERIRARFTDAGLRAWVVG